MEPCDPDPVLSTDNTCRMHSHSRAIGYLYENSLNGERLQAIAMKKKRESNY